MKQLLLGNPLGRVAMSIREMIHLASSVTNPENAGMVANDHLAAVLLTRLCKGNGCFLDVGAHIGSIVAEVMHQSPSVKVIAIEAIPDKVDRLRRKFPGIEIHSCAVGESSGEIAFFVNTRLSGFSSMGRPSPSESADVREIRVPLRTLNELIAPGGAVEVIKIDVEGAELGVLRGGDRVISENRPTIMFESGPATDDGLGYTKEALWRWFAERDFAVLVPNRVAHDAPGLGLESFLDSHDYPRRTTNYYAVPNERRVEIRDRARQILKIVPG